MHAISMMAGVKVDDIYSVFVNDRYMIPAMRDNFKNPTDPTTGNRWQLVADAERELAARARHEHPHRAGVLRHQGQQKTST